MDGWAPKPVNPDWTVKSGTDGVFVTSAQKIWREAMFCCLAGETMLVHALDPLVSMTSADPITMLHRAPERVSSMAHDLLTTLMQPRDTPPEQRQANYQLLIRWLESVGDLDMIAKAIIGDLALCPEREAIETMLGMASTSPKAHVVMRRVAEGIGVVLDWPRSEPYILKK